MVSGDYECGIKLTGEIIQQVQVHYPDGTAFALNGVMLEL